MRSEAVTSAGTLPVKDCPGFSYGGPGTEDCELEHVEVAGLDGPRLSVVVAHAGCRPGAGEVAGPMFWSVEDPRASTSLGALVARGRGVPV